MPHLVLWLHKGNHAEYVIIINNMNSYESERITMNTIMLFTSLVINGNGNVISYKYNLSNKEMLYILLEEIRKSGTYI